ncbi:MAG TPA: aldo/keto reductase [Kofleriaceae bacterium]|nr:aldo/keto reductase [Kofleriaceae bacterium]
MWSRRDVLASGLAAGLVSLAPRWGATKDRMSDVITRAIPATGEQLPVIGLGSWQTFDVDDTTAVRPVVARFLALGGRVIDSSPMYGRSEAAIGSMLAAIRKADPKAPTPWLATKVWTRGKQEGITQMKRSLQRLGVTKLDLMQIHNLLDWKTHLATLREWKAAGTIRYLGITHYAHDAFDDMEKILQTERLDFVQLPYSLLDRAAEKRLLPAAQAAGAAVLVMEPFDSGRLFASTKGKPLPPVARELGCTSWAQLALKWIVGHPAVTAPIPATSKVKHVEDNLGALRGPVPTQQQRDEILAAL